MNQLHYPSRGEGCGQQPWLEPIHSTIDLLVPQVPYLSGQDQSSIRHHIDVLNWAQTNFVSEHDHLSHAAFHSAWSEAVDQTFALQKVPTCLQMTYSASFSTPKSGFGKTTRMFPKCSVVACFWEAADDLTSIPDDTPQYHQEPQSTQSLAHPQSNWPDFPSAMPQGMAYSTPLRLSDVPEIRKTVEGSAQDYINRFLSDHTLSFKPKDLPG